MVSLVLKWYSLLALDALIRNFAFLQRTFDDLVRNVQVKGFVGNFFEG